MESCLAVAEDEGGEFGLLGSAVDYMGFVGRCAVEDGE